MIDRPTFAPTKRLLLVAEIGNNHEGDLSVALEMVDRAADAGADAVKTQTFRADRFVNRSDADRFARLKRFELSASAFEQIADRARARGLLFISTPLDLDSVDVLAPLVDAYKIASGDNTFFPLIERVAASDLPIVISSGLSDLDQIAETVRFVRRLRRDATPDHLAVLHCVSAYPVDLHEVHLRAIPCLREQLGCVVGYSDHTLGIDAAVLSVALGARIVEKHFTLDKHFSDFRDHQLSATPAELKTLATAIRTAETLLGSATKQIQPGELPLAVAARRSIVAALDLPAGAKLSAEHVMWLRPGGGLPPGAEAQVIGKRLLRPLQFGERIALEDLE